MHKIISNKNIAKDVFEMKLLGDVSKITAPGQFVNIKLNGFYLRRPISVCDFSGDTITIIYKTVGRGTEYMSAMCDGALLDVLCGLGNGFDTSKSGDKPLLIGGGAGVPPMFALAKKLLSENKKPVAVLGFNTADDIFYENEFRALGMEVRISTADGSAHSKGFVTDIFPEDYTYFYACGPHPMLKAVYDKTKTGGQLSFEERMGCGFGACMGCTCKTKYGDKRICKDGPVLVKEEIIW